MPSIMNEAGMAPTHDLGGTAASIVHGCIGVHVLRLHGSSPSFASNDDTAKLVRAAFWTVDVGNANGHHVSRGENAIQSETKTLLRVDVQRIRTIETNAAYLDVHGFLSFDSQQTSRNDMDGKGLTRQVRTLESL
jgi:hypothetical protein